MFVYVYGPSGRSSDQCGRSSTMERSMSTSLVLRTLQVLVILLLIKVFSLAQAQVDGWINIDCGASKNYTDPVTNIHWVTDTGYINTGVNVAVPNALSNWPRYSELTTIRAFNASSAKNCYALGPLTPNSVYTIRGTFLYDNYDSATTLPTFQVAIGTTVVANVSFPDQYTLKYLEFTLMAMSDTIYYCLLEDQSLSTPFISALTVRPINQSQVDEWYPSSNGPAWELSQGYIFRTKRRLNFGGNQILRYPDDALDRYWVPVDSRSIYVTLNSPPLKNLSAPTLVSRYSNEYSNQFPGIVLSTALTTTTILHNLTISFPNDTTSYLAKINIYFAELDLTATNTSGARHFGVDVPADQGLGDVDLDNGTSDGRGLLAYSYTTFLYRPNDVFNLYPIKPTKRAPLVNALEMFQIINDTAAPTDNGEVVAIETIKSNLSLSNYAGDPCLPIPYEWLTCSIVSITSNPQILTLNLSSYSLAGTIPPEISLLPNLTSLALDHNALTGPIPDLSALTALKTLDLQNNNLSGPIPDWLASMPSLTELFLQNNNFSGTIPAALLSKKNNSSGTFNFMYSGNPNLVALSGISSASSKSSENIRIIVGGVVGGVGVLILIIVLFVVGVCLYRRNKTNIEPRQDKA